MTAGSALAPVDDIRQHNRFASGDYTGHTWPIPSATNAIKVNIETIERYQAGDIPKSRCEDSAKILLGQCIVQRHCLMKSFICFCIERMTHLHISVQRDPSNNQPKIDMGIGF
mgnify:CR=1 FL=1